MTLIGCDDDDDDTRAGVVCTVGGGESNEAAPSELGKLTATLAVPPIAAVVVLVELLLFTLD